MNNFCHFLLFKIFNVKITKENILMIKTIIENNLLIEILDKKMKHNFLENNECLII